MIAELLPAFSSFTSQTEIAIFYSEQFKSLEVYLFSLTPDEMKEKRVEVKKLFEELEKSPAIKNILTTGEAPIEQTQQIVVLFATILSKAGIYSPLFSMMSYIPDSSIKWRMKAAMLNSRITNIRTGYLEKSKAVLNLFKAAQFDEDADFTQEIVTDFINYYSYVKEKLLAKDYTDEFNAFAAQFTLPAFITDYSFLTHPSIIRFLTGIELEEITLTQPSKAIYELSVDLYEELKSRVAIPVMNNCNSDGEGFYGLTKVEILNDALGRGKTDFRVSYKQLTPELKVLLYCFFNLKKHFSTSYFIFDKMDNLIDYFSDVMFKPLMIDLGCGPLTSGLALGDYYYSATGNPLPFNYIGIDIAPAMLDKANSFCDMFCFQAGNNFRFEVDWNLTYDFIGRNIKGKNLIIINASYLFASSSLSIEGLANYVNTIVKKYRSNPIYFVFQNSNLHERNIKYTQFKSLILGLQTKFSDVETVKYKTRPGRMEKFTEEVIRYEILSNT